MTGLYEAQLDLHVMVSPPYTTVNVVDRSLPNDFSSNLRVFAVAFVFFARYSAYSPSLNCLSARQSLKAAITSRELTLNPNHVNGAIGCKLHRNKDANDCSRTLELDMVTRSRRRTKKKTGPVNGSITKLDNAVNSRLTRGSTVQGAQLTDHKMLYNGLVAVVAPNRECEAVIISGLIHKCAGSSLSPPENLVSIILCPVRSGLNLE